VLGTFEDSWLAIEKLAIFYQGPVFVDLGESVGNHHNNMTPIGRIPFAKVNCWSWHLRRRRSPNHVVLKATAGNLGAATLHLFSAAQSSALSRAEINSVQIV
jgi:hypothetical protein